VTDWTWRYEGYDPADERLRESLCTLGNGYFAARGALPECAADDVHYPGTYVAGCYNRLTSDVAGRRVENEDMVNLPNWLPLRFRIAGQEWLTPDTATVLDHDQVLHLSSGILERRTRYGLGDGRALSVHQLRLVHMADPHLAAMRTELTAEGFSDELEVGVPVPLPRPAHALRTSHLLTRGPAGWVNPRALSTGPRTDCPVHRPV
jgi:trehalose/maltose hydrolase-like predicted phosphorylase